MPEVISGPSAGSGCYVAFLSAFYSGCAISKNLAITGEFKTKREEIPTEIESSLKNATNPRFTMSFLHSKLFSGLMKPKCL
jgi:hypothetical protein